MDMKTEFDGVKYSGPGACTRQSEEEHSRKPEEKGGRGAERVMQTLQQNCGIAIGLADGVEADKLEGKCCCEKEGEQRPAPVEERRTAGRELRFRGPQEVTGIQRQHVGGTRLDKKVSGASESCEADSERSGGLVNCSGGFLILYYAETRIYDFATEQNQDPLQQQSTAVPTVYVVVVFQAIIQYERYNRKPVPQRSPAIHAEMSYHGAALLCTTQI